VRLERVARLRRKRESQRRVTGEVPARGSFPQKNLNSDDHFDRPFSFMAMTGSSQNQLSNKRKEEQ
jgi:hypothetical protein